MTDALAALELTDEQERAAGRRRGSLLLAAGAGSGKTAVLVERFVRAVVEDGVAPGRILAITFTERAAGELRERVRARLLELGRRDAARQAEAAFVSTFHGFCARLLRAHPLQAGVEPAFRILDEGFASRLQTLAFAEALTAFLAGTLRGTPHHGEQASERERAVDLVAAYGADSLRAIVLGSYAQLRSQGQSEPRLPLPRSAQDARIERDAVEQDTVGRDAVERDTVGRDVTERDAVEQDTVERDAVERDTVGRDATERDAVEEDRRALAACGLFDELLVGFGEAYAARKRSREALDFDDLELLARDLLRGHRELRAQWSERFELLMVDEFQDSNQRQLQILAALDRDNLFTVGDELQSIYSFRHADVTLFRERDERLTDQEASLALTRNFRSRPSILTAVQRIFAERMGRRFAPLVATRESPPWPQPCVELLLCDRRGWERASADPTLAALPEATPWRQAEARLLAGRVGELVADEDVSPGEVVVLLRALGDLPVYEAALRASGLPTSAAAGSFWTHQQVGDLLAWLRALANPLDELALYSALASPLVGMSADALALIASFARAAGTPVWQALTESASELDPLLGENDRQRLAGFRELFASQRAEIALRPIADLLGRAIAATGYERWVLARDWGPRRLASVHKLLRLARSFEAQEGRDLRGFLDHAEHVETALAGREPDAIAAEADAVRLMSIHAAKGLEFPVVCVADLGREPNLRQPELLVDAAAGRVGLRLLDLKDLEATPALAYEELCAERRAAQEDEEDRILYVACTRAQERLLLSGVASFERWPAPRDGAAPISWLGPALVPDLPALVAAETRPDGPVTVELGDGLAVRCLLSAPPAVGVETADRRSTGSFSPASGGQRAPKGGPALAKGGPVLAPASGPETLGPEVPGPETPGSQGPGSQVPRPQVPRPQVPRPQVPRPQVPLGDPDGTISYTSLVEIGRCGYRYYLERVLRIPERRAPARERGRGELDARLRGTIVHALLESVDFARPIAPEAEDVARVAGRLGASVTSEQKREIVTLLAAALAAEPAGRIALARLLRREHPFAFALEPVAADPPSNSLSDSPSEPLVTGFVDLIAEQPDGTVLIVDYKSDRLEGEEDLERLVRRDYGFQRLIYALAAIEGGAREVEVAHWFLERSQMWVSARFAESEREQLRELLRAALAAARARGFAVAEEPYRELCLTCPGRGGLCSWGETHTMRARSTTLAASG